jgi:pimeloyl-ACP methyl ester carboxylesterase
VGYYVALSDDVLLIAIKGTSSLEDILTDTCGRSHAYEAASIATEGTAIEVRARVADKVLDAPILSNGATTTTTLTTNEVASIEVVSGHERVLFAGGDTTSWLEDDVNDQVHCHEGILLSARTVARDIEGWVHTYAVQGGQRLLLVGHSLGASAACLVAMILRLRFACLADMDDRLHVYAFAPPPVLDHDSALACSSYVTTVVHNSDLIPRASLVNLALHLEVLRSLSNRLVEGEVAPTTPAGLAAFVQRVYGGTRSDKADRDPLWTLQEGLDSLAKARDIFPLRHPDHLYIPGRVLLFYQEWHIGEAQKPNQKQENVPQRRYICRVTDGTALALQCVELDGFRWMGDHTTAAYYACLEDVQEQRVGSSP